MSAPASLNSNNNPTRPGPRPVIVTGPTGSGKSSFAVTLAERLGGEIIGADAFQIYAGLPILTAQPGPDLLARAHHHLIGTLPIGESCDAARYAVAARRCIIEITGRNRIPILVGGTGLYLKALTHGLADMPPADPALRAEIAAMDPAAALARLNARDSAAAAQIDVRNPARVRRALEIVLATGQPLAASRSTWSAPSQEFRGIVLVRDREDLRRRIADNVDAMFAAGVVEEVRAASNAGPGASRAIGFREIQALLRGECDLPACREAIFTATRRYAKRQLTWCRNQFAFSAIDPGAAGIENALDALDG